MHYNIKHFIFTIALYRTIRLYSFCSWGVRFFPFLISPIAPGNQCFQIFHELTSLQMLREMDFESVVLFYHWVVVYVYCGGFHPRNLSLKRCVGVAYTGLGSWLHAYPQLCVQWPRAGSLKSAMKVFTAQKLANTTNHGLLSENQC